MNYQEAIAYLLALPDMERASSGPGARVMNMDAMRQLLAKLNNPQLGRRTIHVTGSKGKGSTSIMIAALLQEAGLSTGLYTSPHLHQYTERICFNRLPCSYQDFASGVESLQKDCNLVHQSMLGPISTFGALTALFFLLAREKQVDWQVVEVGMGGTTDATNVFADKVVAVITPISLEHVNVLGKTVEEIAASKAGIITPGSGVILAPQQNESVVSVIKNKCHEVGAELIDVASCYKISAQKFDNKQQSFILAGPGQIRHCTLKLLGEHQLENAMTAFAACDYLTNKKQLSNFVQGSSLEDLFIPGRLEVLSCLDVWSKPEKITSTINTDDCLPITKETAFKNSSLSIIVDGAHNGESARKLACALRRHFQFDQCFIVIGVNKDKNIFDILVALKEIAHKIIITSSASNKAMPTEKIAKVAEELAIPYEIQKDIKDSLTLAYSWTRDNGNRQRTQAERNAGSDINTEANTKSIICVTGSFYLVAEAREYLLKGRAVTNREVDLLSVS